MLNNSCCTAPVFTHDIRCIPTAEQEKLQEKMLQEKLAMGLEANNKHSAEQGMDTKGKQEEEEEDIRPEGDVLRRQDAFACYGAQ